MRLLRDQRGLFGCQFLAIAVHQSVDDHGFKGVEEHVEVRESLLPYVVVKHNGVLFDMKQDGIVTLGVVWNLRMLYLRNQDLPDFVGPVRNNML